MKVVIDCKHELNISSKHMQPSGSKAVVQLFGDFDPKGERIIRDPYYGGAEGFEHNFKQVTRASEGFLKHLNLL